MLKNLALQRPLAVLDLETTGTDPQKDRIVEVGVLKLWPDGRQERYTRRVNPGIPIPPEASAIHGIRDADVAGAPRFEEVADSLLELLQDCDLCGFNLKRFDLRLLYVELGRVGRTFPLEGRAVIDAMEIFHRYEPRDLAAAVRFYLGRELKGAHSADADSSATAEVLDAMLARYADLPRSVSGLHQHFKDANTVDSSGCFVRVEGQLRFAFGKYRGQALETVAATKPDYLDWMLNQAFFDDAKQLVRDALARARAPADARRRADPSPQP
jgi:DNA polymerase-3 subunit epsilon